MCLCCVCVSEHCAECQAHLRLCQNRPVGGGDREGTGTEGDSCFWRSHSLYWTLHPASPASQRLHRYQEPLYTVFPFTFAKENNIKRIIIYCHIIYMQQCIHELFHIPYQVLRALKADTSTAGSTAVPRGCRGKECWWLGLEILEVISLWILVELLRRYWITVGLISNRAVLFYPWVLYYYWVLLYDIVAYY